MQVEFSTPREVLGWLYTIGGGGVTPPPPQTKVTIVGKNEIDHWEHLVGPFLGDNLLGLSPLTLYLFYGTNMVHLRKSLIPAQGVVYCEKKATQKYSF